MHELLALSLTKHVPRTRGLKRLGSCAPCDNTDWGASTYQTCSPHTGIETYPTHKQGTQARHKQHLTKHVPRTRGLKLIVGGMTLFLAGEIVALTKHVPRTRGLKLETKRYRNWARPSGARFLPNMFPAHGD